MTLDQLRGFLTVAETSSFHRAARSLGTPQPTLSARVKALENHLGFQLFRRANNGVRLTREGHRFRQHAEVAVSAMEIARGSGQLPKGSSRTLSIGLPTYLAEDLGSHLIQQLPTDVVVRIEPDYSGSLIGQVADGLLDVAIVFVPRLSSDLQVECIGDVEVVLVATPECDDPSTLSIGNYIHVQWGHTFAQFQSEALGARELPRLNVNSPSLALKLILERGGSAYLDRQTVAPHVASGRLRIVATRPAYKRPAYLVWLPRIPNQDLQRVKQLTADWLVG